MERSHYQHQDTLIMLLQLQTRLVCTLITYAQEHAIGRHGSSWSKLTVASDTCQPRRLCRSLLGQAPSRPSIRPKFRPQRLNSVF